MIPQYLIEAKDEIKWVETKSEKPEALKSERAIVHFISTIDLDRQRDIVIPKGMVDKDFDKSPSVWYNHNYTWNPNALPIAKSQWRRKKEEGILAKTEFAKTEFADDVYRLHEGGFMNTWSIGFRTVKDRVGIVEKDSVTFDEKRNITTYHKWELLEYSSAPIAANPNASDMAKDLLTMNFKSDVMVDIVKNVVLEIEIKSQLEQMQADIDGLQQIKELLKQLIEKTDSNEKEILQLTEFLNEQENKITKNISIELPVNKMTDDRIKTIVSRIVDGGR
uniref:Putative peptidase n=1 Tax=viral metagenome TaxID=1070528 RepID=A0A6M3IYC6_9ZZZZ